MPDQEIIVPTFALPFRMGVGGTFACVEQDSYEDVSQSVAVLLQTPLGGQVEIPDYGYEPGTFDTADLAAATAAVEEWEPRAAIGIESKIDSLDDLVRNVRINLTAGVDSDA